MNHQLQSRRALVTGSSRGIESAIVKRLSRGLGPHGIAFNNVQHGGMRAGFEYFKAFSQDVANLEQFSKAKLSIPVLRLTGEKASGDFLIEQASLVAADVRNRSFRGQAIGSWKKHPIK